MLVIMRCNMQFVNSRNKRERISLTSKENSLTQKSDLKMMFFKKFWSSEEPYSKGDSKIFYVRGKEGW